MVKIPFVVAQASQRPERQHILTHKWFKGQSEMWLFGGATFPFQIPFQSIPDTHSSRSPFHKSIPDTHLKSPFQTPIYKRKSIPDTHFRSIPDISPFQTPITHEMSYRTYDCFTL
ncbi:MAG: hypothetical protein WBS20_10110, partial [Lysobacterales bacterium]